MNLNQFIMHAEKLFNYFSGDCLMSEWTSWTGCTATCGETETRVRRRLVLPWSSRNHMTCDGTIFTCMTGSLQCNIGDVMGPSCSDGSEILDRIGRDFECDLHTERVSCNFLECPRPTGKKFNIKPQVQCLCSWSALLSQNHF